MIIEFYVNMTKGFRRGATPYNPKRKHAIRRRMGSNDDEIWLARETYTGLSEQEKAARERLEKIADRYNLVVDIIDLSHSSNRRKAFFRGIRNPPIIIIDKHKFNIDFKEKDIIAILESKGG